MLANVVKFPLFSYVSTLLAISNNGVADNDLFNGSITDQSYNFPTMEYLLRIINAGLAYLG